MTRAAYDYYPTPAWCVRRLLEAVDLPGGRWLEPAVGDGAIVRSVDAARDDVRWTTIDVRPGLGADHCLDYTSPLLYREIRSLRIYEGASEVQQLIIGRDLLKNPS